jgi:hypothetical protein
MRFVRRWLASLICRRRAVWPGCWIFERLSGQLLSCYWSMKTKADDRDFGSCFPNAWIGTFVWFIYLHYQLAITRLQFVTEADDRDSSSLPRAYSSSFVCFFLKLNCGVVVE